MTEKQMLLSLIDWVLAKPDLSIPFIDALLDLVEAIERGVSIKEAKASFERVLTGSL